MRTPLSEAAAGMSVFVGLLSSVQGGAHLLSVIGVALTRGYAYNFRLTSLVLIGALMVLAGVLCLASARAVAAGRRSAWWTSARGTLLLLLVVVPLIPIQTEMASGLTILGVVNLAFLYRARPGAARSPEADRSRWSGQDAV